MDRTLPVEMGQHVEQHHFALPVNKDNAIASGIVKEADRALMVDTIYMELPNRAIDKSEMMLLDVYKRQGTGRPAPLDAMDRADRLPDGAFDRRAHPQPADRSRASSGAGRPVPPI